MLSYYRRCTSVAEYLDTPSSTSHHNPHHSTGSAKCPWTETAPAHDSPPHLSHAADRSTSHASAPNTRRTPQLKHHSSSSTPPSSFRLKHHDATDPPIAPPNDSISSAPAQVVPGKGAPKFLYLMSQRSSRKIPESSTAKHAAHSSHQDLRT